MHRLHIPAVTRPVHPQPHTHMHVSQDKDDTKRGRGGLSMHVQTHLHTTCY